MFGLSMDFMIGLLLGLFLGMFLGSKKFRESTMNSLYAIIGRKPKPKSKEAEILSIHPIYFDEQNGCPKCGSQHITTQYNPETNLIDRQCRRCHSRWSEKPLDS